MRNTPAGNPTVTENYGETNPVKNRYSISWEDKNTLRIWDNEKQATIWNSEVNSVAKNLIEAFGINIPDNPYDLPKDYDTFDVYAVVVNDSEYLSHEEALFWNEDDALRYAEGNPGWYGAKSVVRLKKITVYGKRP
jgi:hypothetical protein